MILYIHLYLKYFAMPHLQFLFIFLRRCICFDDISNQEHLKSLFSFSFILVFALTVFFLSLFIGGTESAYRTEQGIPFYIGAITLLLSSKIINLNGKKALKIIASLSLVIILTVQICSSNYWYHVKRFKR